MTRERILSTGRAVLAVIGDLASITAALMLVIITGAVLRMAANGSLPANVGRQAPQRPNREPISPAVGQIALDNGAVLRTGSPKIALIEFADYECSYCGKFQRDIFQPLKAEFFDSGKVAFVYRDFPLSKIHPEAVKASLIAGCARAQGKFWPVHDQLFEHAGNLSGSALSNLVSGLKLNGSQFDSCIAKSDTVHIKKDQELAAGLAVSVTPTFFLGVIQDSGDVVIKKRLLGALPYDAYRSELNAILASER